MNKFNKILLLSLFLSVSLNSANARNVNKRQLSVRRNGGIVNSQTNTVDNTSSSNENTALSCEDIFYKCMEKKTTETVSQFDIIYNDYTDMLSDIYSGMMNPPFKCIYSNRIKSLYTNYYFGKSISSRSSTPEEVGKNSIEYYNFLKQHVVDISSKKIEASFLLDDVIKLADLKIKPLNKSKTALGTVSYKITLLEPDSLLSKNIAYCKDPALNKNLSEECSYLSKSLGNKWLEQDRSMTNSCKDYEIFLTEKLNNSKKSATDFINSLRTKLTSTIDEYNTRIEAEEQLKKLETEEENLKNQQK